MFKVLCVTHSAVCVEPFLTRIKRIAEARPAGIILREKKLDSRELCTLAEKVSSLCSLYHVPLYINGSLVAARKYSCDGVHLPMPALRELENATNSGCGIVGASVHSVKEAEEAVCRKASYLVAGHIFATSCKPGVPPRGVNFLQAVCRAVPLPVYAIGGITPQNVGLLKGTGIAGVCVMSGMMTCPDPALLLKALNAAWDSAGEK